MGVAVAAAARERRAECVSTLTPLGGGLPAGVRLTWPGRRRAARKERVRVRKPARARLAMVGAQRRWRSIHEGRAKCYKASPFLFFACLFVCLFVSYVCMCVCVCALLFSVWLFLERTRRRSLSAHTHSRATPPTRTTALYWHFFGDTTTPPPTRGVVEWWGVDRLIDRRGGHGVGKGGQRLRAPHTTLDTWTIQLLPTHTCTREPRDCLERTRDAQ